MDPDDPQDREHIAYHEAAHAIVGVVLGLPVTGISIGSDFNGAVGEVERDHEQLGELTRRETFEYAWRQGVFGLAGEQGEIIGLGSRRGSSTLDRQMARQSIEFVVRDENKMEAAMNEARQLAEAILQKHEDLLHRLAGEVMESGEVSGKRLKEMLSEGDDSEGN